MPALVMRAPPGSLLEQTCRLVVRRQIAVRRASAACRGASRNRRYNARDLELTYQYSSFGVPGLGLEARPRRGPRRRALRDGAGRDGRAARGGAELRAPRARRAAAARYGFYEALDYTPARLPEGETVAVVRAYMAHHQGMTAGRARQRAAATARCARRFHAEPIVQATELLLQERTPRDVAVARPRAEEVQAAAARARARAAGRCAASARRTTPMPRTHLLSNGRYAVMITAAGSGYSRWRDLAVTRWREDVDARLLGQLRLPARRRSSGEVWSAGYQPSGVEPDSYEVDVLRGPRRDPSGATARSRRTLEVVVSPEDDAEVRRVSLTNLGSARARDRADLVRRDRAGAAGRRRRASRPSPTCSSQTEFVADARRAARDAPAAVAGRAAGLGGARRRSSRARRVGDVAVRDRPGALPRPRARRSARRSSVIDGRPLSNTAGAVLDPIFSLRRRVRARARRHARASRSRRWSRRRARAALDLADKYRDPAAFERAVDAGLDAGAGAAAPPRHRRRRGAPLPAPRQPHALRRPGAARRRRTCCARNARGPSALWAHGISGDLPIVLRADRRGRGPGDRPPAAARARVLADEAARGRSGDPERAAARPTRRTCRTRSRRWCARASRRRRRRTDQRGRRVRPARRDRSRPRTRTLLQTRRARGAARAAAARSPSRSTRVRAIRARRRRRRHAGRAAGAARPSRRRRGRELEFFNGLGGFADGRPRVRDDPRRGAVDAGAVDQRDRQPAASASRSSESGAGYTWAVNSQREPAHAVVQRSGQRSARRGDLRARRGERRALGADGAADPRGGRAVRRPARPGLQPLRARRRTASRSSCCSSCRSTTRSRSRG